MQLNHGALTVRDRERSAAFYTEHFGLTDRVHDDAYLLILSGPDGGLLALSEGEPAAEHLPRTNHFGFLVTSPDEVHAARRRLREAGVPEAEWQDGGMTRVQVADPDGYRGRAVRVLSRVCRTGRAGSGRPPVENRGWLTLPSNRRY
jgi:catechol 2,3-dioxygenase-like lactoylglutathione lyase family enzyme